MKKSDELFLKIFDSNPIGMTISNLETTKFQYVNDIFLTTFGYRKEEVIDKTAIELKLIEPDSNEKIVCLLRQYGYAKDIEILGRKKNGKTFWALASVQVITIRNENFVITSFLNITERKKVEDVSITTINKLSKSEHSNKKLNQKLEQMVAERTEQLELIHKNISDYKFALDESCVVAVTDQKGIIQYVNDNFCKISKYTKDELVGRDHRIINSGYHSKKFIRDLWATIAEGNVWKSELKNKAKDGVCYWLDTTIIPFLNKEGKVYKYLAIHSDITKRVNSFEAFKISEERFRDLFENALVAILIADMRTFETMEVNDVGVQLYGYASKKDFLDNFKIENHFANPLELEKNKEILKEKGEIRDSIRELKKLDGTHFWAKVFIKLNSEKTFGQIIIVDITEQVLIFKELKKSEENHRNIYKNSLVAMFTTDMKTLKAIQVNDMAVNVFGYKSKMDFIANYNSLVHFVNLDERKKIIETLKETGEVRTGIHEMKKVNGTCFYAKMFVKLNFEKTIAQTVIIDVTEQMYFQEKLESKVKERTLELTESLVREKEMHDMKSNFISMASHEFRTPLSSILSSSSLIEMYNKPEQEEQRLKHINRISASVKNLTDILDDFLTHEKLEQGIVEIKTSVFNLPEFINTIVEEMNGIVNEKRKHIKYNHDGELIVEQSNKILRNILLNLLSNASKYSLNEKEILLTSSIVNNQVSIVVKDCGIGIPKKDQKKIFSQFFRASNAEHIQGTGLGLNIVKKYLELINGTIKFTSKLGEGTTFTIEFPKNSTTNQR